MLRFDAPEAGRYLAPIVILPGLFQSLACWRALTGVLAHRGWEVYFLEREGGGWEQARTQAFDAVQGLEAGPILFGADVGAALALSLCRRLGPMAMALFAPCMPTELAGRLADSSGLRDKFGRGHEVTAPAGIPPPQDDSFGCTESSRLLAELASVAFEPPALHAPTIVFAADGDPLVAAGHSLSFAQGKHAKAAASRLGGRWWPPDSPEVGDEVHRFLILTLGDRVVEFPEDILDD
jgi:hypothetical protein